MPDAVPAQQDGAAADRAVSAEAGWPAPTEAAVHEAPEATGTVPEPETVPDEEPEAAGADGPGAEAHADASGAATPESDAAADAPEAADAADASDEDEDGPRPLGLHVEPTGYAPVDGELRRLEDADHLAVSGHLEVYEDVHRGLREALAGLDRQPHGGPPQPGHSQPGPNQPGPPQPGPGAHPGARPGPHPGTHVGPHPGRPMPGPHHPRS
jgi:hypothetical protein